MDSSDVFSDENGNEEGFESTLLNYLESITNIFDLVFFLRSTGLIKENNFFYRNLNRSNIGSKIWFVTLILSIRKLYKNILKSTKLLSLLKTELTKIEKNNDLTSDIILQKIQNNNTILKKKIKNFIIELIQDFIYLIIVSLEIFKISISKKLNHRLEILSNSVSMLKFFTLEITPTK
ncbi:hypothetical protein TPHA_0E03960 [Tetrapisispora phaffii CBS 4417]|uniref:Uncharacterized protein n=1 Tax=Tetrapisispora phaffii (strain ATCC 24235 / CBS 4417 / NBRC 1672 / NRRL Y-8282 / UCD 70-5) TaxID=1071381 RepID=G8BUA7_TETPH|nr:hypothetical protein TPHA_0E03960 [Tetrapisispora phaffii CBS 4417]CCE63485.1 hypothetical protein TPHA_0E03960 [Tetrapisispora phaffii CBS 4417]